MATGDTNDVINRLRATLAPWFPDLSTAPVLTAILTAIGDAFSFCYSYLSFAKLQTRIKTATGGWLDMIARDYFAGNFVRRTNEADSPFQARILKELLRPRQTRVALTELLNDLTGTNPVIREMWNLNDMGSYNTGEMGYGVGLGYGSLQYPYQIFIDCYTPGQGIPSLGGYGCDLGGYGVGNLAYGSPSMIVGPVTNAEIMQRISQTVAAGITAWTNITVAGKNAFPNGTLNGASPQFGGLLGLL